jgi:hypothetical protein
MPSLAEPLSAELEPITRAANGVALAGHARDGGFDLGVAWREGCGAGDALIVFQRIEVRIEAGGLTIATATDALTVDGPGAYGPPAIVHVGAGFERPVAPSQSDELGGWAVAYRDHAERRISVRRIGKRATTLLDDGPAIVLGAGLADGGDLATRPWLYGDAQARVQFAYFDGDVTVTAGRFSCEGPTASGR